MYCLILHLPFILFKFKEQILSVWQPIETLIRILQIAFSHRITEQDLDTLQELVHDHLHSMKNIFGQHFRPKHHFLTHYGTIIKASGPLISYCHVMAACRTHLLQRRPSMIFELIECELQ